LKNLIYNTGYFVREAMTIIRLNMLSNVFSLLSTGLIFFILAMVVSGWWISNHAVEAIKGEAEINVYYAESTGDEGAKELAAKISGIDGVREVRLVDADEAYKRMESVLGKEARVLGLFDDNPFSPFIEVSISLESIEPILKALGSIAGIEHVRDNREVLERISGIAATMKLLGYLVVAAVGISTLVIISHIIRMGIFDNREQINTLRLMGAQEAFIAAPFILEGLLLNLGGGALASALGAGSLKYIYERMAGPLTFVPLPPLQEITSNLVILVMAISIVLGVAGSCFGFSSSKGR
jgi:cell division transport system permease protein